jgi:hypothetical protein
MEWYVWVYNHNDKKIEKFNVFNSVMFSERLAKTMKRRLNKEEFCEELQTDLMYAFWSAFEYETTISSFPQDKDVVRKVDIYEQVMLNFDAFAYYVWCNKRGRGIWDKLTTRCTITTER